MAAGRGPTGMFAADSVQDTLQRIVDLAEWAVDGCEAVGILFCLDASTQWSTFYADDLIDDPRWPTFGSAAVALGVRSVLAYSLSTDRPSALNMYARLPAAFSAADRAQGQLFATVARLAIDTAEERASDQSKADNLTAALRTRELIGQAQGIMMERERITADQAFDVLRRASGRRQLRCRPLDSEAVPDP